VDCRLPEQTIFHPFSTSASDLCPFGQPLLSITCTTYLTFWKVCATQKHLIFPQLLYLTQFMTIYLKQQAAQK